LLSNEINEDVTFSTEQYGYTISITSFCYMLSKLVVGSLNDVFQARNVLVGSLLIISLSTLLMSQAESVAGFYLCIAINALCQGGGWTAIIKLLKIVIFIFL
jgi:sugar phosphate permease